MAELATGLSPHRALHRVTVLEHLRALERKGWVHRLAGRRFRNYNPTNHARLADKATAIQEVLRRYAPVDPQARELVEYLWPPDLEAPFI